MWRAYVADIGCMLVRRGNKRFKLPFYSELVKKTQIYDSRSGQEIVDSIVASRRKKKIQRAVNENEIV